MNELQLTQSKLLEANSSTDKSSAVWASSYAADLWSNPLQHKVELGVAAALAIGAVTAGSIAARRLYIFLESEPVVTKTTEKALGKITATTDNFYPVRGNELSKAVSNLKEESGLELTSFGATRIEGAKNSQTLVLRSSTGDAMKVQKGEDVLFAHKISSTTGGETTLSYYTHAPFNLKNPWITNEGATWPLNREGPIQGLKQAGVEILELQKPRGFHYTPDLSSLTIKWTDLKVATQGATKAAGEYSQTGRFINQQDYVSVKVTGPNAALTGLGEILLSPKR